MKKNIFNINFNTILLLIISLGLIILLQIVKRHFTIQADFYLITINLNNLILIIFLCLMFMIYKEYKKNILNEFYYFFIIIFILVLSFIICIICLKVLVLKQELLDYLIHTKFFSVQILYSSTYKNNFINETILLICNMIEFSEEEITIFKNIIPEIVKPLLIMNPQMTLVELENRIVCTFICTKTAQEKMYLLQLTLEMALYYKTSFIHNFLIFTKNAMNIYVFVKTLLTLPSDIIIMYFFKDILYQYIYQALFFQGVFQDMTPLEIKDLCEVLAVRMLQRWPSLEILMFIFR